MIDSTINVSNFNFVFNGIVSNHYLETWIFSVTDEAGQTKSTQFTLTIKHSIKSVITTIENQYAGSNKCFFSSLTELTYTVVNSPSYCTQIDFGFYNSTTGGVLVSPTNTDVTTVYPVVSSWAIKNNTLYALTNLNASDFASVTDGSQIVSYASSTNQTEITNLVNGIVIAFKTASGKMGLAKVISVYGSPTTFGAVDLAIKVEQ